MTTYAYMNHGRWVADCARPYCGGAERVNAPFDTFFCHECGQFNTVDFPNDARRIERLLAGRPNPVTRNWHPGETYDQLVEEDRAHGLEHA